MNQRGEQRWHHRDYQQRAVAKAKRIGIAYGLNSLDAYQVATMVVEYLVERWKRRAPKTNRRAFEWAFAATAKKALRGGIERRLELRAFEREQRAARRLRLAELLGVRR